MQQPLLFTAFSPVKASTISHAAKGKVLSAQEGHRLSPYRRKPFLTKYRPDNCWILSLIEDKLLCSMKQLSFDQCVQNDHTLQDAFAYLNWR